MHFSVQNQNFFDFLNNCHVVVNNFFRNVDVFDFFSFDLTFFDLEVNENLFSVYG